MGVAYYKHGKGGRDHKGRTGWVAFVCIYIALLPASDIIIIIIINISSNRAQIATQTGGQHIKLGRFLHRAE